MGLPVVSLRPRKGQRSCIDAWVRGHVGGGVKS